MNSWHVADMCLHASEYIYEYVFWSFLSSTQNSFLCLCQQCVVLASTKLDFADIRIVKGEQFLAGLLSTSYKPPLDKYSSSYTSAVAPRTCQRDWTCLRTQRNCVGLWGVQGRCTSISFIFIFIDDQKLSYAVSFDLLWDESYTAVLQMSRMSLLS